MVTVVLCIVYFLACGVNRVISKDAELLQSLIVNAVDLQLRQYR